MDPRTFRTGGPCRTVGSWCPSATSELVAATEAVAAKNLEQTTRDEDIWVTQRVSRGIDASEKEAWPDYPDRTVIVECRPLSRLKRWRLAEVGGQGRPGTAAARALLESRVPGAPVPDSVFERRLFRALRSAGLPEPVIESDEFYEDLVSPATGFAPTPAAPPNPKIPMRRASPALASAR